MATYSSSGDPKRSLELLWRSTAPPARGPKPGLTVDQIVDAAVAVADADGLPALSMRKVAQALSVGTMSLYTYVPAKAELLDLMVDRVHGEALADPLPAGDWRARVEAVAREAWDLYHRHPWLLQIAAARPVLGPNVTGRYDRDLSAVDGIGLGDLEMDAVVTLVAGHVEGAARRSVEAALAERVTGQSDLEWWEVRAPILERLIEPERFPVATRVGPVAGEEHQAPSDPDHAFAFGLQRILDGIEALVRARTGGP